MNRNINKILIIFIALTLAVISLGAVSADDLNSTNEDSFSDLQDLIDKDTSGEITLNKNYTWHDADSKTGVVINKTITVNGNNFTLNGNGQSRILNINASNVILKNIVFENGNATHGGAIYFSDNRNILLTNNSYLNNNATYGGAIFFNKTSDVNITNSIFENNTYYNVDTSYINGPLSYLAEQTIIIYNTTFANNNDLNRPHLIVNNFTKYYSAKDRLIIQSTLANSTVEITINDRTYRRTTNESGFASIAINLNSGIYETRIDLITNNSIGVKNIEDSKKITVEIKTTVNGSDIVKVYRNGTQYWGLFLDENGNPIANKNVSYNINGVFYNRSTNASGWSRLNINLEQGNYILTAINPVTGEFSSNNIRVLSRITENNDLIKTYGTKEQFTVRVIDSNARPVGSNVNVTFNINGVFYIRTTDSEGYARLNINLMKGEYIITTYFEGCREANIITVVEK